MPAKRKRTRRLNSELLSGLPIGELIPVEQFRIVEDANAAGIPPGYGIEVVIADEELQALVGPAEAENPKRKRKNTGKKKRKARR